MPIRIFSAIELPSEWHSQLNRISAALQAAFPPNAVRWVKAESIHLTLKFYGEVAAEKIPAVHDALRQAVQDSPPLKLAPGKPGLFPGPLHPRVIWLGIEGDLDHLRALQNKIEAGAAPLGFPPEARGFTPHLTLGRVNEGKLRRITQSQLEEIIAGGEAGHCPPFTAEAVSLMRSDLRPSGAVYTRLFTCPLGGKR